MKRKSFGKLAIVSLLAVLMLFGFASCSKKAETPSTTTTASTTAATTTTTTTTTTASAPAVTTVTTPVVEESAPVVEESAPVVEEPAPVEEETVVEEPVVVTPVEEEIVVAEEEVPAYSTVFSYNGITASISAYSDYATVSVPAGVTEEDISDIASLLLSAYPEAAECTYAVEDGVLYLTYPEQAMETVKVAVETLSSDAVTYIAEIAAVVKAAEETVQEVEEVVAEGEEVVAEGEEVVAEGEEIVASTDLQILGDGTIVCTYNYRGEASAQVVMGDEMTVITYPAEYVYASDIEALISRQVAWYPELADNITYEFPEEGTIVFYYPADYIGETSYDRLYLLAECNDDLTDYVDSLLEYNEVVVAEEVVVAAAEEEAVAEEETVAEELPVISSIFAYNGIKSNIVAYSDHAVLTLPEGVTEADIAYCAQLLVEAYPEAADITYLVKDGSLSLFYPEQNDELVLFAVAQLEKDAMYFIDSLEGEEETAVAAVVTPVEEEAPVVEAPVEETPVVAETPVEEVAVPSPVEAPVAVEEKGKFIQGYSVSLTNTFKGNLESGRFVDGVSLKAEAKFSDHFAAGVRFDIDIIKNRKSLGFGGYVRGIYPITDKIDVYGLFGVSGLVGIINFEGTNSIAFDFAAGLEYKFTPNWSAFAEFSARYAFNDKIKLDLGGAIGARYTF